ncbi:MAG: carboxypeptidase-like regulatory domain-containing protein, partial [Mediterranea sp.]|nr:carboxypeptidase-like regulatory domain-containing protein [Mediterranea sp.]
MDVRKALLLCLLLCQGAGSYAESFIRRTSFDVEETMQTKGIRVSGTVTDKEKSPLPGVNVRVKGENATGVITDMDGHFYLDVPDKNAIIEISYIGFQSQEIKVGN